MTVRLLVLAVAVLAAPALAETSPIVGVYADAGGCARLAGQPATTDMLFILTPTTVERYESICEITTIAQVDDVPVTIEAKCVGEGESWVAGYNIAPIPDADGYVLSLVESPETLHELRRCK